MVLTARLIDSQSINSTTGSDLMQKSARQLGATKMPFFATGMNELPILEGNAHYNPPFGSSTLKWWCHSNMAVIFSSLNAVTFPSRLLENHHRLT